MQSSKCKIKNDRVGHVVSESNFAFCILHFTLEAACRH